jgi:hypothetical protein
MRKTKRSFLMERTKSPSYEANISSLIPHQYFDASVTKYEHSGKNIQNGSVKLAIGGFGACNRSDSMSCIASLLLESPSDWSIYKCEVATTITQSQLITTSILSSFYSWRIVQSSVREDDFNRETSCTRSYHWGW